MGAREMIAGLIIGFCAGAIAFVVGLCVLAHWAMRKGVGL